MKLEQIQIFRRQKHQVCRQDAQSGESLVRKVFFPSGGVTSPGKPPF